MTQNTNIINNNLKVNNNDFIVYDIYEENNEMQYFFVCQNSGIEKTLNTSFILEVFKTTFLSVLSQQLLKNAEGRLSISDFTQLVWNNTCNSLNVNLMFAEHYVEDTFVLNQELNTFEEEDILKLNIECFLGEESYLIFRSLNDNLKLVKKEYFLSRAHDLAMDLKLKYEFKNVSKKMVELNKEALSLLCVNDRIKYFNNLTEEDTCNHEFVFKKKHEPLEPFVKSNIFFYSFSCKHCGKEKYILNNDILDAVQENVIKLIKHQLFLPKAQRTFNFRISEGALKMFLEKEKIDNYFVLEYKKDYSLPTLNKEVILVNPEDLQNNSLVFTNSICKNHGIFEKEVLTDVEFIVSKNNQTILFTEKNQF